MVKCLIRTTYLMNSSKGTLNSFILNELLISIVPLHSENRTIHLKSVEPCCQRENYCSWEKHGGFFSRIHECTWRSWEKIPTTTQNRLFTESQLTEISYCKQGVLGPSGACRLASTTFLEVFLV